MSNQILFSQITGAIGRQRNREVRQKAQAIKLFSQVGKVMITNLGTQSESVVTVNFVNPFTQEPTFSMGSVMDVRQQLANGTFPTASATVQGWATEKGGSSLAYIGATIAIVTTGLDGQQIWVHYRFEGTGLSFALPTD